MKHIDEIRRANLARLRESRGTKSLCDALQRSESQISQWVNGSRHSSTGKQRNMRSSTARWIESMCGLPDGWLDSNQADYEKAPRATEPNVVALDSVKTAYSTWPFNRVSIERFMMLPEDERAFIEGRLVEAIIDAEMRARKQRAS